MLIAWPHVCSLSARLLNACWMLQGSVSFKWAWNSTLNKFTAAPEGNLELPLRRCRKHGSRDNHHTQVTGCRRTMPQLGDKEERKGSLGAIHFPVCFLVLEPTSGPFAGLCCVFWWPVCGPPVGRPGKVCRYCCDPEKLASVAPAEADCFSWVVPWPGPACPAVSWWGRKGSMPRPAASVVCVGIRVDAGVNHRGKGTPVTRGSGPLLYRTENCGVQRVRAEAMSSQGNKTWH